MSVYKEGYHIITQIFISGKRIYPDAADYGAPTIKGDKLWKQVQQLIDDYGIKGSRRHVHYITGSVISHDIQLMDEWNNGRIERFRVMYVTTRGNKHHDGYFTVEPI